MKHVRFTLSLPTPVTEQDAAGDADAVAAPYRETARLELVRRQETDQVTPNGSTSAPERRASVTLAGAMTPSRRGTGLTLRPMSPARPAEAVPAARDVAVRESERSRDDAKKSVTAKAREKFAGLMATANLVVAVLEVFEEDRTPTQNLQDSSRFLNQLFVQATGLTTFADVADAGRRGASCLQPEQHRQIELITDALSAYSQRAARLNATAEGTSKNRATLLRQLRNATTLMGSVRNLT